MPIHKGKKQRKEIRIWYLIHRALLEELSAVSSDFNGDCGSKHYGILSYF